MRRLLPVILALLGLGIGLGAGLYMRPEPQVMTATASGNEAGPATEGSARPRPAMPRPTPAESEVIRLPSPFLIPLITEGRVQAMVVIHLAMELLPGHPIELPRHEPRLRALLLQLLFDHANLGGFDGVFTRGEQLLSLRRLMTEAVRAEFGDAVHDILIIELVRQNSP